MLHSLFSRNSYIWSNFLINVRDTQLPKSISVKMKILTGNKELGDHLLTIFLLFPGKVHGSLARAGKVKGQTPRVSSSQSARGCMLFWSGWYYFNGSYFM